MLGLEYALALAFTELVDARGSMNDADVIGSHVLAPGVDRLPCPITADRLLRVSQPTCV